LAFKARVKSTEINRERERERDREGVNEDKGRKRERERLCELVRERFILTKREERETERL
jgi:hypothetical protein